MELGFREQMRRLVHFWVEMYRREPDLMTVMINEVTRSYEFLESHDIGTVMVAFEAIEGMIRAARDRGEIDVTSRAEARELHRVRGGGDGADRLRDGNPASQ